MNSCLNTSKPTQEDFDTLMKVTNYPFCKLPKTHPDNHFLSRCTLAKKYGYTQPYDQTSDETRADFKKKQAQRKKTADADKNDADDLKKAENDRKARGARKLMLKRLVLLLLLPTKVLLLLEKVEKDGMEVMVVMMDQESEACHRLEYQYAVVSMKQKWVRRQRQIQLLHDHQGMVLRFQASQCSKVLGSCLVR